MYIWKHIKEKLEEHLPTVDSWGKGRGSNEGKKESFMFPLDISVLFQPCAKKILSVACIMEIIMREIKAVRTDTQKHKPTKRTTKKSLETSADVSEIQYLTNVALK